jgi:hypothetical protein
MSYVSSPVGVPRIPSDLGGLNLNPYPFLLCLLLCSSVTITQRLSLSRPTKPLARVCNEFLAYDDLEAGIK